MKLHLLTVNTRHFCFEACGETSDEAYQAMRKGLEAHARQVDIDPNSVNDNTVTWIDEMLEDAQPMVFETGRAYRDSMPLPTAPAL